MYSRNELGKLQRLIKNTSYKIARVYFFQKVYENVEIYGKIK